MDESRIKELEQTVAKGLVFTREELAERDGYGTKPRRFSSYSSYDNYTHTSETRNVSSIIDRVMRVTTKVTESYAGDILYTLEKLDEAARSTDRAVCEIISFREGGTWSYPAGFDEAGNLFAFIPREKSGESMRAEWHQFWLLAFLPIDKNNSATLFKRVEPYTFHWEDAPEISEIS